MNPDKHLLGVDIPSALPTGTRLLEFELLRLLGVGGFGIVYLAFDHALEREVAIKEYMPASLAGRSNTAQLSLRSMSDADTFALGLKSFVNEARLLARFDHPSLLKVHRFWEANGTAYMSMPVLRGRTVKDIRLAMAKEPDEAWMRTILDPLLGAVEALHSEGVYHRDIAPDNIQVEPDGRPVLLDFGAARRVISDQTQSLTAILKPAYAPIEQYAEAGSVKQGPWTDIYSLGATLHFLLLGRPPPPATARAVHAEPLWPAGQTLPSCSAGFLDIIDWMLEPRPSDRPQSVLELRRALDGDTQRPPKRKPFSDASWDRTVILSPPTPQVSRTASPPGGSWPGDQTASLDPDRTQIRPRPGPREEEPFATPTPGGKAAARPNANPASPSSWESESADHPVSRAVIRRAYDWLSRIFGARSRNSDQIKNQRVLRHPNTDAESNAIVLGKGGTVLMQPKSLNNLDNAVADSGDTHDNTVIIARKGNPKVEDATSQVVLTVVRSDVSSYVGKAFPLRRGTLTVGRESADISIPDPGWSSRHATIEVSDASIEMTDLGSSNGTFINNKILPKNTPSRLYPGAKVRLGSTEFVLALKDATMMPDLSGTAFADEYVLEQSIHSSPKGVVYRARKRSGLLVAVKILSPDYALFPGYRDSFANEAKVAIQLEHPNICRMDNFGESDIAHSAGTWRLPFISYEMMQGGSLATRFNELKGTSFDIIAKWILVLADALEQAHVKGVIHGNIKPSAICFDRNLNPYLTDFAIGQNAAGANSPVLGAPAFMAPEQLDGKGATAATDQYSLAVITYWLLSGSRPYEGQEDEETRHRNLLNPPTKLHIEAKRRLNRSVPSPLTGVLNKALAADPSNRFETMLKFAEGFRKGLHGSGSLNDHGVFISYRRDQSAVLVTYIAKQLEVVHGIQSFVDTHGLDGAVKFPKRIQRAIEGCSVFVCVMSGKTLQSKHVVDEIHFAHGLEKPMIPVFQEDFLATEQDTANSAINDLLQYDGVRVFDKQNIYIDHAVNDLARRIIATASMDPEDSTDA